jgi:hypothetical protein
MAGRTATEVSPLVWWALPRFSGVEAWPGRGWLVELDDGSVQFVHDLSARLPAGVEPDRRFYDPPPVRRVPVPARARPQLTSPATRRRRAAPARPHGAAGRFDEPFTDAERPEPARPEPPTLVDDETAPYRLQTPATRRRTSGRAGALLRSLLDPRQRTEWERTAAFWVHGDFGSVRLGRMYRLLHRPARLPGVERHLCVITHAHGTIPPEDEWTSMVLTLAHDPDRFFTAANVLSHGSHRVDVRHLRAALDTAIRVGDGQHAILLATDLGLVTGGVELDWARAWIDQHAALDPASAEPFRRRHLSRLDGAARSGASQRVPRAT